MSELRNRKADSTKPTEIQSEAEEPDYALFVPASQYASVSTICGKLSQAGFYVTVRRDQPGKVFVLVRLKPEYVAAKLSELPEGPLTPAKRAWISQEQIAKLDLPSEIDSFSMGGEETFGPKFAQRFIVNPVRTLSVGQIQLQYGDQLATYFAFAEYLNRAFVAPALFGIVSRWFLKENAAYSPLLVATLSLWSIAVVADWPHAQRSLSAVFPSAGDDKVSPLRCPMKSYSGLPSQKREVRRLLYWPVLLLQIIVYATGLFVLLAFEIFCTQLYNGPFKPVVSLLPTGATVVATRIFAIVYGIILNKWMTWEDYATEESYEGTKAQRLFYLSLLLNYMPLFLTAYVYLPFGNRIIGLLEPLQNSVVVQYVDLANQFQLNTDRLVGQAFFYSVTNQLIALASGVILPVVLSVWKARRADPGLTRLQSRAPFDVSSRFAELVALFGYVVLVTPVWPLAGVAALIGSFVHVRASLVLLAYANRRPLVHLGHDIGRWLPNMTFLAGLGAVTGTTLVVMYGSHNTTAYGADHSFVDASLLSVLGSAFLAENLWIGVLRIFQAFCGAIPVKPLPKIVVSGDNDGAVESPIDKSWQNIQLSAQVAKAIN